MSQTQRVLELNGRKITLIGTAHVSSESIKEVEETIKELKPDCVAIELDDKRAASLSNKEAYAKLDIIQVLKRKEGFLLLANLILASFQRKMGKNVGVKPGDEMLAAMNVAKEMNIPTVMADRQIQITLKRAWSKNSFWGKAKLMAALVSSAFSKEEYSPEQIEEIKNKNEMDSMMAELSESMPVVKKVLIDERNEYLASKIWSAEGNNVVAVLGAGHLDGVEENIRALADAKSSIDLVELNTIPKKAPIGAIFGWGITIAIFALFIAGFIYGGSQLGTKMILEWVLWNGILAAIFTAFAGAHPITIVVAFISAPITSLCPFVGCGFVTAIVQALICKPRVKDMETLQDDITLKGFYKNRILRVLFVFFMSSIGSSIATFIGIGTISSSLGTSSGLSNEIVDSSAEIMQEVEMGADAASKVLENLGK